MRKNKPLTGRESSILAFLAQSRGLGRDEITRILEELESDSDARMIANVLTNCLGINGGTKCDVLTGPCACGAWHFVDKDGKRK